MTDYLTLGPDGRVADREGKTLEFKRDLSSPNGPLRTMVAFANSAGGRLVVGVEDDGTVAGLSDPVAAELQLANLIADAIRPQLLPTIELLTLNGRTVLVAHVPAGSQRPYYLRKNGRYAGTYLRLGPSNRRATAALVDDLARGYGSQTFDRQINPSATIDDLDPQLLQRLLGRPVGEEELLTLELARHENGRLLPTNAGLLATCSHPERFFPHAWVQCGRFRGPDGLDLVDQADVRGPLLLAVDEVMTFLQRHRYLRAELGAGNPDWNWRRTDIPSIPETSIRELVVNALVHSSYSYGGAPIKLAFYDERIVVENPGGLVPGVTIDQITHGVSVQRNPVLARVFREAGLVEMWGMGLRTVIRDLAANGYGAPEINELHERLRVTIRTPSHDPRHSGSLPSGAGEGPEPTGTGGVVQHHDHTEHAYVDSDDGRQEGRYDVVMMRAALNGPVHRDTLLAAAGLRPLSQNYTRHVVPLLRRGLLAMTVPDKPRSKAQRYMLTDQGRAYLSERDRPEARS